MSVFDLDTRGAQDALDTFGTQKLTEVEPSFGYGVAKGVGMGIERGAARTAQAIGLAGSIIPTALDTAFGTGYRFRDSYFRDLDALTTRAVDYWTPGAAEVGKAGQVLGGLAEVAAPLVLGRGNPTLLLAAQQMGTSADLAREGVAAPAAVAVGTVQTAAAAAGFKLPFLGRTLTERMLAGAAGNLATNVPAAALSQEILKRAWAADQAERFDPMDPTARAVDVLTGMLFGGIAHATAGDAVRTARNAKHFQEDSAPRPPETDAQSAAHQQAMDQAFEQMVRGDGRVDLPGTVGAEFEGTQARVNADMLAEVERVAGRDAPVGREGSPAEPAPRMEADTGRSPEIARLLEQAQAEGAKSPEASNLAIGLREFQNHDELLARVEHFRAADPTAPMQDVVANAVESMRLNPDATMAGTKPAGGPAGEARAQVPEVSAARAALAERPDLRVRLDDGTEISAADHLARIEQDLAQGQRDASAYEAAVQCFLRTGT